VQRNRSPPSYATLAGGLKSSENEVCTHPRDQ
jgi:hypothetical protein